MYFIDTAWLYHQPQDKKQASAYRKGATSLRNHMKRIIGGAEERAKADDVGDGTLIIEGWID